MHKWNGSYAWTKIQTNAGSKTPSTHLVASSCPEQNTSRLLPEDVQYTKNRTELHGFLLDQPWKANISWRSDTSFFYLSTKWVQRKRNISWLLTATSFSEALAMTADSRFHNQLPQIGLKCSRTCEYLGKCFTPLTSRIITPPISWVQQVPLSHTCSHVQCLRG